MSTDEIKSEFDIPDIPDYIPKKYKPYFFILFVLIIQFSGGLYLASVAEMTGSTGLKQEDILMATYASLVVMSMNFALMFRIQFRFSAKTQLLATGIVLIIANIICANTTNALILIVTCFISGWFRMQGTFACNSTIQLWLTPKRDMSIFFCYVYIIVDSVIQLSGIFTIYTAFFIEWEYMHWIMTGILALMMLLVLIILKPVRGAMYIPLLRIDWIGSTLWCVFMLTFSFLCVYGEYYDWWQSEEMIKVLYICILCLGINLWRASFLRHPYISFRSLTNKNVIRASVIYLIFFTLIAPEHVFENSYTSAILGYDKTNIIDLNIYVFLGIICGCAFTFFTFALRKWRYKTMTIIGFLFITVYLTFFYFFIDYGMEKETLFIPLFIRGFGSVIISIVFLTSIVQSGLPFQIFPQALTINGFMGAVLSATLCPAIIGRILKVVMAKNTSLLSSNIVNFNPEIIPQKIGIYYGMIQQQSLIVSMKEIYGWLLMIAILTTILLSVDYNKIRSSAIFPKWSTIRKGIKHTLRIKNKGKTIPKSIECVK